MVKLLFTFLLSVAVFCTQAQTTGISTGTPAGILKTSETVNASVELLYAIGNTTMVSGTDLTRAVVKVTGSYETIHPFVSSEPLPPPVVTTNAATSVTSFTATLNGSGNPTGEATTGWFRYSTVSPGIGNNTFGTRVPVSGGTALGAGSSPVSFSEAITGLAANTTYYYCAIADNPSGMSFGNLLTFTTPAAPPVPSVTTNAATTVTALTATLNGAGNPNGSATTGWFRYSTVSPGTGNNTFGTRVPVSGGTALGAGSSQVSFSEAITGLAANTTYYYCAIADNPSGLSFGAINTFTTPALASVGNVGIGTTTPNINAALEISSSNKGLLIPRTSTASRTAIVNPPKGLMVYDSSFAAFYYYDGGRWRQINDKNGDSLLVIDTNPGSFPVNMGPGSPFTGNISGILYDDGGPTGNYGTNVLYTYNINWDSRAIGMNVIIDEMNMESPYDNIYFGGVSYTGTTTGTYFIPRKNNYFTFTLNTNLTNSLPGFKIRWSQVLAPSNNEVPPLYGWHFDYSKIAARGGIYNSNNWAKDSLGFYSFAFGNNQKVKGNGSVAFGIDNIVVGKYSFASGGEIVVTGDFSSALGISTSASGDYSTAMGNSSNATGVASTAIGYYTTASGISATALGDATTATGGASTAMGSYTISSGSRSTAMGSYTNATGYSSLVAGIYNDSLVSRQTAITTTTPIFIIGNGNSNSDRTNAFVVLKNGNVAIGDNGNPVNKLQITGSINNVGLADNTGMVTFGYTSSTNMVIDQNDLQVRLSGAASDLYLQRLGGNIGIGNTGVPSYQLELSSNSAGKPGSSTWSIASDSRLKQNINPYTQGLQQLMQINPVSFHYNEQSGFDTKPEYVGIIAQDLQKIAPYMVSTVKRKDTDYLSVDNGAMTYMLINAVKEQQAQIEKIQAAIELLKIKK